MNSMPGVGASASELRERLTEILCATPPLMRVLTVARHLYLPDWLVFSGAVYQPVLNHLTGRQPDYGIKDYDLGYFDDSDGPNRDAPVAAPQPMIKRRGQGGSAPHIFS